MKAFCHIYAQWDQLDDAAAEEEARHLSGLGLPCDATFSLETASSRIGILKNIEEAGGICAPNIYPASLDPSLHDSNWWKYPAGECTRLLGIAREQYASLGLGPMEAINTYTPGNSLIAACREADVRYLLGFCAPIVIKDGGWEIAHYGAPLSPYFASDEDFRKPEAATGRPDAVLIASMELRNPLVALNHWNEGPWCPLNAQAADRWLEPGGEPLPFLQVAEDWIRQAELTGEMKFFHLNLQYFFAGRCSEHNRRALEWLARQRDLGRLEVGGLKLWRQRLLGEGFPRQVTYWRGEMMGFHVGHRPGCFADVVVEESLAAQRVWQKPDPLPARHYDYEVGWDYPAFQPDGSAPASTDFSDIEIHVSSSSLEIDNRGDSRRLPILLWDVCEGMEAPFSVNCEIPCWSAEVVPHPAGAGGALRLEGEVPSGKTIVKFSIRGAQSSGVYFKSWQGLVEAQTFHRNGRPYTVLAAQTPGRFTVKAAICGTSAKLVEAEHLLGIHYTRNEINGEPVSLTFDGSHLVCWHRLWDVTADQIVLSDVGEAQRSLRIDTGRMVELHAPGLAVGEPGYQLFGNIRDHDRWDRSLALNAGAQEIERINAWFHHQRPESGEFVVEAHPGVFLPRGSIIRVLGDEFDSIRCAPGIAFRDLCVDYPQCWDWGVAAWVQWRHLMLEVGGLAESPGRHHLHLHAFDPEARDIIQQVYFFDPRLKESRSTHRMVDDWHLPRGIENRFFPEALCSVEIPAECLAWPALGIWIVPRAEIRLYDWIAERGAPGLFSHLWITRA